MNIYLVSLLISLYYIFFKLIEYRISKKDTLETKQFTMNIIYVFVSSIVGCLTITHVNDLFGFSGNKTIPVFVKEPDF